MSALKLIAIGVSTLSIGAAAFLFLPPLHAAHAAASFTTNRNGEWNAGLTWSGSSFFSSPPDVALDTSGNIYVSDRNNQRVVKLNPSGAVLDTFTASGSFGGPFGLALDPSGNIYVADEGNNRIVKLDPSGAVLDTFTASRGCKKVCVNAVLRY